MKDLGVIGHGVQHHRSKMVVKGQEFKGEISALKTRGSVQNNKHGSKLTRQR